MDRKIVMLLIAIVAIGMFALPNTLALYSGQHTFIAAADVKCETCHGGSDQIGTELAAGGPHSNFSCKNCHGFVTNSTNPNTNDGTEGHAAVGGITCIGCHAEDANYKTDVLDSPDSVPVATEIGLVTAAHRQLYIDLGQDACLACHTAAGVTGTNITNTSNTSSPLDLSTYSYS